MTAAVTHQARKSERTRERLLDATLEVIANEGFTRATTARICEVAGVSRGAQTHHYSTKEQLVVAALGRRAAQQEDAGRRLIDRLQPEERGIRTVIQALWDGLLDERFSATATEVLVAARTNAGLRAAVIDADRRAIATVVSFADDIVHPTATIDQLAEALEMTLYYLRGLTLERGIHDDDKYRHALVDAWCDTIEHSLASPD